MSDGIAVEGSGAGAVRQNMFDGLRLAAGAERAREILRLIPALQKEKSFLKALLN